MFLKYAELYFAMLTQKSTTLASFKCLSGRNADIQKTMFTYCLYLLSVYYTFAGYPLVGIRFDFVEFTVIRSNSAS